MPRPCFDNEDIGASDTSGTCHSSDSREKQGNLALRSRRNLKIPPAHHSSQHRSSVISPQNHDAVVGIGEAADEADLGIVDLGRTGLAAQLTHSLDHMLDAE